MARARGAGVSAAARSRKAAAAARPPAGVRAARRALQLGSDALIGLKRGLGPVPGPPVGIGARIGGLGDGVVGPPAIARRRGLVDGGTDQRVAEGDPGSRGEQPGCLGGASGVRADAKAPGRAPQQGRVAYRLGGGEEQEALGHLRKRRDPPLETLLYPAGHRQLACHAEPARQFRGRDPAGQFEQRQRVAAGLRDNPVADPLIDPAGNHRGQQGPGVSVGQALEDQLGQARDRHRARVTDADDHRDRFGFQPAGHEGQDLGRGLVQPLRVIDQAQQRLVRGHLGQQGQNRQTHEEAVRCAARTQPEGDAESITLRSGQPDTAIQHPAAELVQRREGQLHLRLDALSACHLEVLCGTGGVTQQLGLADTGLAAHHQRPAVPRPDVREQPVENHALLATAAEHHHPLLAAP